MVDTLMVAPPSDAGGIGKYSDTLSKALSSQSVNVNRFNLEEGAGPIRHVQTAVRAGFARVDIIHIQFEYAFFTPRILFAWVFFPLLFILSRLRGVPIVITMHEVWRPDIVEPPGVTPKRTYVRLTHRLLAATTDQLVFLSENAVEAFEESVPEVRAQTFPHGVDVSGTRDVSSAEARQRFGIDPDATVISQIGYVSPRKNTDVMVKLAEAFPEYEFLVAGGPRRDDEREYFDSIRSRAAPNLTVTGVLSDDDFHAAFAATDLAVLSYSDIRQSGILNWCFAYRIPMICRQIPYFERVASEGGGIVLYERKGDLAAALREALSDLERLEREMDVYREVNSFKAVAGQHAELYRRL